MMETETTRNSRHTDPDHRVAADRVGVERGGGLHGSTSGITQAPRCLMSSQTFAKNSKIIYSAASASEDIIVYLALYK